MRLKHCEIVTDCDKLKVDIQATCMEYKTIKKWAYIKHDKDDTRPHYHIYLNFGNAGCETSLIAKWFQVEENFIERIKGRQTDIFLYLIHGNDTQQYKHQYAPTEVTANFDFGTEVANAKILGNFKEYSYAQQLQYVYSLPKSEKVRAHKDLLAHWKLYCQWLTLNPDRDIDVMFICGKGGTGKTYYAKKFLEERGLDFCISSSSNDPFQDYLGQKAIILDDLRDKSFSLEDLLKILDNNTASSVKSRFDNKVFNGEMIIITSSVPLIYWYKGYQGSTFDTLDQLYRRISCYVQVTNEEVIVFNELDKFGKPYGIGHCFRNEVQDLKKTKKEKKDFSAMFAKFCQPADSEVYFNEHIKM